MLVAGREVRFYPTNLRYYYHANHLGSGAMVTDNTGAAFGERMYYPYGQSWSTAGAWVTQEFAAFRDSVLGGDDVYVTPSRHYRTDVNRWMSPDPLAGDVLNPQSLNRYAYVLNNPINLIDPLGGPPETPEERRERIQEHIDAVIARIGRMEARTQSMASSGCSLDWAPIPCSALAGAIRAGATNVDPDSLRVSGGTINFTVSTPGTCVSTSDNLGSGTETRCSDGYSYIVTLPLPDYNPGALTPDRQYVLGEAGRRLAPVADPRFIGGWYGTSALAAASVMYTPALYQGVLIFAASNPAAVECASEFVQGYFFPPSGPKSWCGAAGAAVSSWFTGP
jgi:RHS repeat-associated protein